MLHIMTWAGTLLRHAERLFNISVETLGCSIIRRTFEESLLESPEEDDVDEESLSLSSEESDKS